MGKSWWSWEANLRIRFYFRCWEPRWVCGPARLNLVWLVAQAWALVSGGGNRVRDKEQI